MKHLLTMAAACTTMVFAATTTSWADGAVGTVGYSGSAAVEALPLAPEALVTNPMAPAGPVLYICGGAVSSGTPIAGDANGANGTTPDADDGNSGVIGLTGIPAGSYITRATLYWNVLTNSEESTDPGMDIQFDGHDVSGAKIGFAEGESPCFVQSNTVAWKADVTDYVSGNGNYTVSGFPGSNNIGGADFTEGATLNVVYDDGSSTLRNFLNYEGLLVTNDDGDDFVQTLSGFTADSGNPVEATWYPVIGNGQIFGEVLSFEGLGGGPAIDLGDDAVLDGGTQAFAAGTCSYLDNSGTQCYWDDDMVDVSSTIGQGSVSATVNYEITSDCHSASAMQLVVSTNEQAFDDFCRGGAAYADDECPVTDDWKNHGKYVSCVAQASDQWLHNANVYCDEIHSCIVNPRARSDVGKKIKGRGPK